MIGQHPQMYGLPETHLFCYFHKTRRAAATLRERSLSVWRPAQPTQGQGLLRAVAELFFGGQTAYDVVRAQRWLQPQEMLTPQFFFKVLADRLFPLIPVDKSPSNVHPDGLRQIREHFPEARFLHLVRHPRGQVESSFALLQYREKRGPLPEYHWMRELTSGALGTRWLQANSIICEFLKSVPEQQHYRVRGEDLLLRPKDLLPEIAAWLAVRTDPYAIEQMLHPERSPYAFLGPPGARFGNDRWFLESPALRPTRATTHHLDDPVPWQPDESGFSEEVKNLARVFGYT
jgi:hypothetical protein